ncbi:MAG: phosphoethanolamine--lipid A transferase [Ramlibacter sp.]
MRISDAARPKPARPAVHTETLVLACAAFLMLAGNGSFWRAALADRSSSDPGAWLFAAAVFFFLGALYFAAGAVISTRHTVRPLLAVLLLATAAGSYYMDRYGIYLDRVMLRNVLATDFNEARELLSGGLALHVAIFGVFPAALLWWPHLKRRPLGRAIAVRVAWVLGALAVAFGSLLLVFADFGSLMRNNQDMRYLITPGNIIASLTANAWGRAKRPNQPRLVVGADARVVATGPAARRPSLLVLVVGETARAQNFSLNGYARPTNPRLARRELVNFPDAVACGTSTEVSLPCMFSHFGRARYDEDRILTHESVLHVLARAGVPVLWRDNQSGCKGVCDGLPVQQMNRSGDADLCRDGQCFDEILLGGMDKVLRDNAGNLLVVMHQLGSHGPAYYLRYPPAFRQFMPQCETEELRQCKSAEIVNAYDNSLLYTDFVLDKTIDLLDRAQKTHDTALLYVSDHGESLGEKGLYLHGMPWAIAPDVQTRIPFFMWLSPALRGSLGLKADCLSSLARQPASHDNLFHSLLGFFDVRTQAYDRKLDLFAQCREGAGPIARETKP